MVAKNLLYETPPYTVEQAVKSLGKNLRTARLRRNLTIADVAEKIGTGPRAVSDAEKGKLSTGVAVYSALLWVYDLLGPMAALADPAQDEEGRSERADLPSHESQVKAKTLDFCREIPDSERRHSKRPVKRPF